jgi:hypothetical protein
MVQRQGVETTIGGPEPGLGLKNIQAHELVMVDELADQQPEKTEVETDLPETHELEDEGDSEAMLRGEKIDTPFDQPVQEVLPQVSILPRRARPQVRYLISENYNVFRLDKKSDRFSAVRHRIADAIAKHLRSNNLILLKPGDWRHISRFQQKDELQILIKEETGFDIDKIGSEAKHFAILLYNGDVITPAILFLDKRWKRSATRAGVLRDLAMNEHSENPRSIAGEIWDAKGWKSFKQNEQVEANRYRRSLRQGVEQNP